GGRVARGDPRDPPGLVRLPPGALRRTGRGTGVATGDRRGTPRRRDLARLGGGTRGVSGDTRQVLALLAVSPGRAPSARFGASVPSPGNACHPPGRQGRFRPCGRPA